MSKHKGRLVVRLVISVAVMISALLHEVVKENWKQVLKRMMTVLVELALLVLLLQQCKNGTCSLFQAASTVVRQAWRNHQGTATLDTTAAATPPQPCPVALAATSARLAITAPLGPISQSGVTQAVTAQALVWATRLGCAYLAISAVVEPTSPTPLMGMLQVQAFSSLCVCLSFPILAGLCRAWRAPCWTLSPTSHSYGLMAMW